jgi:hypothetical protein
MDMEHDGSSFNLLADAAMAEESHLAHRTNQDASVLRQCRVCQDESLQGSAGTKKPAYGQGNEK